MLIVWILLIVAACAVLVLLREFFALWVPLAFAINKQAAGRTALACKLYARVIATPCLLSDSVRRDARFRLSWLLMEEGRFDEAAALLRSSLQVRLPAAAESNIRQRLAEALEGAGHAGEAQEERDRAAKLLSGASDSAEKAMAEAGMLQKNQRFEAAYAAFERGLSQIPIANSEQRARVMTQLGLAAFNAGRPADAVRWSERAIALNPRGAVLMTALSTAGLGYAGLGKLEQSEQARLRALELATRAGNKDAAARYMAQVAETRRRRGQLVEAMQMCERALGLTVAARRSVYATQYEYLCNWGRFEEAATVLNQAQSAHGFPTPSAQQRMSAVFDCETALILAERGLPEQAPPHMAKGLAGLHTDTKTSARYQAGKVWILALIGQKQAARLEAERIEFSLDGFAVDRATQRIMLAALGRAWVELEDPARSLDCWQRYQALEPDPIMQPRGYYFVGECLRRLGDLPGAKAALQQAVDLNIDCHHAALARKRLAAWQQEEI